MCLLPIIGLSKFAPSGEVDVPLKTDTPYQSSRRRQQLQSARIALAIEPALERDGEEGFVRRDLGEERETGAQFQVVGIAEELGNTVRGCRNDQAGAFAPARSSARTSA